MRPDRNYILTGVICAIAGEVCYGLSYCFTKTATENASSLSLLGWRFFVALIVILALKLTGAVKISYKGKNIKELLLIAFLSPVLYFTGETFGISNTTASESGIILACIPVMALVASTVILKKKPTRSQVTGILITMVGVVMTVIAAGLSSSFSIKGYLFLIVAVLSFALYCVFVDRSEGYTSMDITFMMIIEGSTVFVALAVIEALVNRDMGTLIALPFTDTKFLTAVLFQGIGCSVFALCMTNIGIARIGTNRTSSFVGISTVVSIFAGVFILGERLLPLQIAGAVVIIAGVYIANMRKAIND